MHVISPWSSKRTPLISNLLLAIVNRLLSTISLPCTDHVIFGNGPPDTATSSDKFPPSLKETSDGSWVINLGGAVDKKFHFSAVRRKYIFRLHSNKWVLTSMHSPNVDTFPWRWKSEIIRLTTFSITVIFTLELFPLLPRGSLVPGRPRRPWGPVTLSWPGVPVAPGWPRGPGGPWRPVKNSNSIF